MRTRHPYPNPERRACLRQGALAAIAMTTPWLTTPSFAKSPMAPPAEVRSHLPGAVLRGSGGLRFVGLRVYHARLWVQDGFSAADYMQHNLALELEYERKLKGHLISERSITEIRKLQDISDDKAQAWLALLLPLFPDVGRGDRITGIQRPGASSLFYVNGQPRGDIQDTELSQAFFSIWFSPRTSEPQLRSALLKL